MVAEHFTMLFHLCLSDSLHADKQEFGGGFQKRFGFAKVAADMGEGSHMTDSTITSYLFIMLTSGR